MSALFEARSLQAPNAVAVAAPGCELTYGQLNQRAESLAADLRGRGAGPEVVVGVRLGRSVEYVTAVLAALKAGAAFLPLDPAYPAERLALMIQDSGAPLVVTAGETAGELSLQDTLGTAPMRDPRERENALPDNLAYVIYTSGSTGRPKGVEVPHRNLVALTASLEQTFSPEEVARVAMVAPTSFDASVWEIALSLLRGTTLVIPSVGGEDPQRLSTEITALGATFVTLPPSVIRLCPVGALEGVRVLVSAGEECTEELARAWKHGRRFVNAYGPTEITVCATVHDCADGVAIGVGLPHAAVHVVAADGSLCGEAVAGELAVAGSGVARGYRGRPEETARRFVPDPFGEPGGRMYLTGDLGGVRRDGAIAFRGRADEQVKVHGNRVEPGEVETFLRQLADVDDVAVVQHTESGDLVGYLLPRSAGTSWDVLSVRAHLAGLLPEFMIPSHIVLVPELPRTPAGKVDRATLAARPLEPVAPSDRAVPLTPTEELVASAWSAALEVESVAPDSNFFELGGHSLLATQVIARVRDATRVDVPIRSLFEYPTLRDFAATVDRQRPSTEAPPLEHHEGAALSFLQERMWFLERLDPDSRVFSIPLSQRLRGTLDVEALSSALRDVVNRHQVLRTGVESVDGKPVATLLPTTNVDVPLVDLSAFPEDVREREAARLVAEETRTPIDIARPPLLRARLLRLADDDHILLLTSHHIALDGWSMGLVMQDLSVAYAACLRGEEAALPAVSFTYADFARWQREWLGGPALAEGLEAWRAVLDGAPLVVDVPADRPRPNRQAFEGAQILLSLPSDLADGVRSLARASETTTFMVLLTVFGAVVRAGAGGQADVLVATPVAGRSRPELEEVVGPCLNIVPIRVAASPDRSFREALERTREATLDAFEFDHIPFERIVEAARPKRTLARNPLCQVSFSVQSVLTREFELEGLELDWVEAEVVGAKYDLAFVFRDAGGALDGALTFNAALFGEETARRWAKSFVESVRAAVAAPDAALSELVQLPVGGAHECIAGPPRAVAQANVAELVDAQITATPAAAAIQSAQGVVPYAELGERVDALAAQLVDAGLTPGALVGICLERSPSLIAGELAVLRLGGVCVPVDVADSPTRLRELLGTAPLSLLLTERRFEDSLSAVAPSVVCVDRPTAAPEQGTHTAPHACASTDLAYVVFTSGSTGSAKGVMLTHGGIVSYVDQMIDEFELRPDDRVVQLASPGYDASIRDLIGPLAAGATVVLTGDEQRRDADAFLGLLETAGVTVALTAVPSFVAAVDASRAGALGGATRLRLLATSGEAIDLLAGSELRWVDELANQYGPTECTMTSTVERKADAGTATVGTPIPNTTIWILDAEGRSVPRGASGEIGIAGAGVARGYLDDPAETARRFVPSPTGSRLFRTGDRGRLTPDGELEFLGRGDRLVKIRGNRVQLEDVERRIESFRGVQRAAAVAMRIHSGHSLEVHVEAEDVDLEALEAHARDCLPHYLSSTSLKLVGALPRTSSGKIDYPALAARGATEDASAAGADQPPVADGALASLWCQVLEVDTVQREDNFFESGGHSLLMMVLVSRIRRHFDIDIDFAAVFECETFADLEQTIAAAREAAA